MKQYQCPRFHLYNAPEGHQGGCPVCAAQDAELARTRGLWSPDVAVAMAGVDPAARTLDPPVDRPAAGRDVGRTVGRYDALGAAVDPVVGWLVCVAGADKGRDWRLVGGLNAVGRGDAMPVRLNDPAVSRERHALISFDPRSARFLLAPGEGRALVYCNGQEVLVPVPLRAHDRIELGGSTLVFVPLVGADFGWDA
jgi:hypothetical protein